MSDYEGSGLGYSHDFQNGGFDYGHDYESVAGGIGRWWNSLNGTAAQNEFNSAEAAKARDLQLYMSNTAYQRAVADMKAAGLNPASLGGNAAGSPASTPSAASAHSASNGGVGGIIGTVVASIVGGIGMAARNSIARSALSTKDGYLDLKKIETQSKVALNAAKQIDMDANTALKKAKDFRDFEFHKLRLDGKAMHTDLEEQRFYNTQLKNILLKQKIKRQG